MLLGVNQFGSIPIGYSGQNAAQATFPALVIDAVGVVEAVGVSAVTIPELSLSAVGAVEWPWHGVGAAVFPALLADAVGVVEATGSGSVTIPALSATAAGNYRTVGIGATVLPQLAVSISGVASVLADDLPADSTYYYCTLTGAADGLDDVVLPMSNFSVRHRADSDSYYSVTIPGYSSIDAIVARSNGQIVISSDTAGVQEELMRGSLGDVRTDRGPNSQTISISGNASQAATATQTFVITAPSYAYSTFAGEQRLRITPRSAIRPGHYARYESTLFEIGTVTWSVSASAGNIAAQMEIATLAA